MKRVKNRTLYDTDEAELIAEHAPITDRGDFDYLIEKLYKTADGDYFLHGQGGAKTEYAQRTNGGRTDGEEIRLLTEDEALDWCEDRSVDGEVAVGEFGHLIE